jgi:hypothetical protein
MPRRDEADEVRDDEILFLRQIIAVLVGVVVLGTLAAILGGPAAIQALQAVQAVAGTVAP